MYHVNPDNGLNHYNQGNYVMWKVLLYFRKQSGDYSYVEDSYPYPLSPAFHLMSCQVFLKGSVAEDMSLPLQKNLSQFPILSQA